MAELRTSFIPKKTVPTKQPKMKGRGAGIFTFIAFVIFIVSLLAFGGLFLYKTSILKNIEEMSQSIDRVKQAIDPELVANLIRTDIRLKATKTLLEKHNATSPIFGLLEELTLKSVSFNSLDFSFVEKIGPVLNLSGVARDYASLALQSDSFGGSDIMLDQTFSNLGLTEDGYVRFSFKTTLREDFVLSRSQFISSPDINTLSPFQGDVDEVAEFDEIISQEEESSPFIQESDSETFQGGADLTTPDQSEDFGEIEDILKTLEAEVGI